jgi:hypothetical protein
MKISQQEINRENGTHYYRIFFEVLMTKDISPDVWIEVNHRIEDLIEEYTKDKENEQ